MLNAKEKGASRKGPLGCWSGRKEDVILIQATRNGLPEKGKLDPLLLKGCFQKQISGSRFLTSYWSYNIKKNRSQFTLPA